jgi:transcriptional regulator with XRE-family HTH domain
LGEVVREKMALKGLFQREVASYLGISVSSVQNILDGKHEIGVEKCLLLAHHLGFDLQDLLPELLGR